MKFSEYFKLEKSTQNMIFRMYRDYCDNNIINKKPSKDWFRWLTENFNIGKKNDAG